MEGRRLKKVVGGWQVVGGRAAKALGPDSELKTEGAAETGTASEPKSENEPPSKHVRLTDRDRQLMGMLATVRYLSLPQLARLLFAARSPINLHKRLLALAGEGRHGVKQPFLKQLKYRTWEGMPQTAWTLTPLGYAVAASVLPSPPRKPTSPASAAFIEHGLLLNELYVRLLERPLQGVMADAKRRAEKDARPSRAFNKAKAGLYARAAHPGFRWLSHDEVRLPWKDYDMKAGKKRAREILPDATLEVPGEVLRKDWRGGPRRYPGRRYFVEAETGSHSIFAPMDTKPGATMNKLHRYSAFTSHYAGDPSREKATLYDRAFPDDYEPFVLFLVRTSQRAAHLNRAIAGAQSLNGDVVMARAMTVDEAASALAVAPVVAEAPSFTLTGPELILLRGFYDSANAVVHGCRAEARARAGTLPAYPAGHEAVAALLTRLFGGRM